MAAASGPFALRCLLSLHPLPHAAIKSRPPPPPPRPLCPSRPSPSPLTPLSFVSRRRTLDNATTSRPTPLSLLLPIHVDAPEEEKGGAFGLPEPSLPVDVMFACHPAAALANVFHAKSGCYNAQVVVGEDEPEDRLVARFRRAASRVGVFREARRRRFFEDRQAELKRRARDAAVRRAREAARLRRATGVAPAASGANPLSPQRVKKKKKKKKKKKRPQLTGTATDVEEEEEDNWELPGGEIPYCR